MSSRTAPGERSRKRFARLMLGSMGVVFGDIGTSPIYGFKTAITQAAPAVASARREIFGVVSLTLWALIIVVTVKYVTFIMRADNKGEGGILSLMALAQGAMGARTGMVLRARHFRRGPVLRRRDHHPGHLGALGGGGTEDRAGVAPTYHPVGGARHLPGRAVALFLVQSRGHGEGRRLVRPDLPGLVRRHRRPRPAAHPARAGVLLAINPLYGARFLPSHGIIGFFVLGSVSLTVTGAEALYADMGHFGRAPIRGRLAVRRSFPPWR